MILVLNDLTFSADLAITKQIQSFTNINLTSVMIIVSSYGDGFFSFITLVAIVGFLIFKGYKKEAMLTSAILIGPIFSQLSKSLVARPRPETINLGFPYPTPADYSFPSGHVIFYTLLFGLLAFLAISLPKLGRFWRITLIAFSLPLIVMVGISRVYLGVHWPTDVIAGYFMGFALLEILILIYLKFSYLPQMRQEKDQTDDYRKQRSQ